MSPRHETKKHPNDGSPPVPQTGQDKERHDEKKRHHPMDHHPHRQPITRGKSGTAPQA